MSVLIHRLVIDNDTRFGIFCPPILVDGHHRLIAAMLARKRRIDASCSGLVEGIEWLCGERKDVPKSWE